MTSSVMEILEKLAAATPEKKFKAMVASGMSENDARIASGLAGKELSRKFSDGKDSAGLRAKAERMRIRDDRRRTAKSGRDVLSDRARSVSGATDEVARRSAVKGSLVSNRSAGGFAASAPLPEFKPTLGQRMGALRGDASARMTGLGRRWGNLSTGKKLAIGGGGALALGSGAYLLGRRQRKQEQQQQQPLAKAAEFYASEY